MQGLDDSLDEQGVEVATNIKARQKLSALYAVGVEVRFGPAGGRVGPFKDPDGRRIPVPADEVAVWVQPPSPLQRDMAMRDAQASRAKAVLRAKKDEESEEYLSQRAFVVDLSDETLVEYLIATGVEDRRGDAVRDVLMDDEWENIESLEDAMRQYADLPEPPVDDPDYEALMAADRRYGDQVNKREGELSDAERESYGGWTRDALERKAMEKRAELVGSKAFMTEFERQMQFYSVRDIDDHGVLFFGSAREFADTSEEVQGAVIEALATYITEAVEAKKLLTEESGSASSGQPSEQEISEPSTPVESTE